MTNWVTGMDIEGIYRKSGGNSQVIQVKGNFSGSGDLDISDPDLDIHAVSSALKSYLRELPMPLITYNVYEQFIEVGSMQNPEQQARALAVALRDLPRAHYDTLQFLVFHLSRVIQHSNENLVSFQSTCSCSLVANQELDDAPQPRRRLRAHNHAPPRCAARTDRYASPAQSCRSTAGESQERFLRRGVRLDSPKLYADRRFCISSIYTMCSTSTAISTL